VLDLFTIESMRTVLRTILFYSFSLFALTLVFPGAKITGGLETYLLGGVALSIIFLLIKPVLNILTLPLNLVTLGAFSFFTNVIILYLLTLFVPQIKITSFVFAGFSYAGFAIPKTSVNQILAFIVCGLALSAIITFLSWLIKK